ncbi:hypothetical protein KSS87_004054, partial [Heliosperma pusillum]
VTLAELVITLHFRHLHSNIHQRGHHQCILNLTMKMSLLLVASCEAPRVIWSTWAHHTTIFRY